MEGAVPAGDDRSQWSHAPLGTSDAQVASTKLVLLQRTATTIAREAPFVTPEQYITAMFL